MGIRDLRSVEVELAPFPLRFGLQGEGVPEESVDGGVNAEGVGVRVGSGEGGVLGGGGAGVSSGVGSEEEPGVDEEALLGEVEGEEELLDGDWLGHQS